MWIWITAMLASHAPAPASEPTELQPPSAALVREPAGEFVLEFADGRSERGGIAEFGLPAEGSLEPLLVRFEWPAESWAGSPSPGSSGTSAGAQRAELELVGGERLIGELAGGGGDLLEVTLVGETRVPLSIDALLSLRFPARLGSEDVARVERPEEGDRLYRRVGDRLDRLDGFVEAFDGEGVRFDSLVGSKQVPWSEVGALFIEPLADPESVAVSPRRVAVDLVNGSRLMGELGRADAAGISLDLAGGTAVRLPTDALLRLSVLDGRLAYLSDLEPAAFEGGSAFGDTLGLVWRPRVDRCVEGGPLLAGNRRVPRGLGVMAPTTLEWELEPGFRVLRGAVAVDASVRRLGLDGSVRFRVLVDGEERFASEWLGASRGAVALPEIELGDARRLRLVAEMGPDYNAGDRADWLDLRLIR
jgi:hypothetical protein